MGHLGWGLLEEGLQLVHQLPEKWDYGILIFSLDYVFQVINHSEACISKPIK